MRATAACLLILLFNAACYAQGRYGGGTQTPLGGEPFSGGQGMGGQGIGSQGLPMPTSPGDSDLANPLGGSPVDSSASIIPPLPAAMTPSASPAAPAATTAPAQRPGSPYAPATSAQPPVAQTPIAQSPPSQSPATATRGSASRAYQTDELMTGIMRRPTSSNLSGTPVRLEQVVASGGDRASQTQRINAYWDLCSAVADYYLGLYEANELSKHEQRYGGRNPDISQAARQWRTRVGTSQLAAVAAQRRLAALMGSGATPLPGDLPLCGAYGTRFQEQSFSAGAAQEARVLDQLIQLRYAELAAAAARVSQQQDFLQQVSQQSTSGQGVLEAFQLLALQRRAFVQIAKDYNRQITRYTELSTPGNIPTGRLVAMLVERPRTASASAPQSSSAGMPPTRPQTFRYGRQ